MQHPRTGRCRCGGYEKRDLTSSAINTNLNYERKVTNMKGTTSTRIRASRFLSDRHAYRERPNYLIEFLVFGIVAIAAILSLSNAVATLR